MPPGAGDRPGRIAGAGRWRRIAAASAAALALVLVVAAGAVRAQAPTYGPTMRLTISPGRPADALFHMPTGQSGHFLSPHYDAGHSAWVEGAPLPLAPGAAVSEFMLRPR